MEARRAGAETRHPGAGTRGRIAAALALLALLFAPLPAVALTLQEAVEKALSRNERPAILAARSDAARARVDAARSRWLPSVTLSTDSIRRAREQVRVVGGSPEVTQARDEMIVTGRVRVPLFDPSAGPLLRRARLLTEGAELDERDERRLLVQDVTEAFLLALSAERVVEAAERRVAYAEQAMGDAEARAEAGLASINDVTKVDLERSTAAREATSARAGLADAYLLLALLVAADVAGPLDAPVTLLRAAEEAPPPADDMAALARERRLDVASRRKLAESWDAHAAEPPRRLLPSLGVTGMSEWSTQENVDGHASDWNVGLGLTWNVWDAGLRAAERAERRALAGEADLLADVLEREVVNEVRRAHAAMTATRDAVMHAERAVTASRRNAEETFELYRQGLRTALEVADAGNRAFDADVSLTRERLALSLAWVDLLAATGSDPLYPETMP